MDERKKVELARFSELAFVGATQAADAFSQLAGRRVVAAPPVIDGAQVDVESEVRPQGSAAEFTGVFFEFEGCLDALVGIVFPPETSDQLVRRIVGIESGPLDPEIVESALMEVGNILASHVASAIADRLASRLLPSIPSLAMTDAEAEFQAFVIRVAGPSAPRFVSVLADEQGVLDFQVILVPTR